MPLCISLEGSAVKRYGVVISSFVIKTVLLGISAPQPILPMEHLKQQIYMSTLQPGSNNNLQNPTCWPHQHSNCTALCDVPLCSNGDGNLTCHQTVGGKWKGDLVMHLENNTDASHGSRVQKINPSSPAM